MAPPAAPPSAPDKPAGTPPAAVDRGASAAATDTAAPAPDAAPDSAQAPAATAAATTGAATTAAPALPAPGVSERDTGASARTRRVAGTNGSLDNIDHPLRPSAPVTHRKRHGPAETHARASADTEPTPAQRREETLMQCRALGYDARECAQRGCMMTRFGLACPG
jgi:hypothetical protein